MTQNHTDWAVSAISDLSFFDTARLCLRIVVRWYGKGKNCSFNSVMGILDLDSSDR